MPCENCNGRGFVFVIKDACHRWQVTCPVCKGENFIAKCMELALTGEQLSTDTYEGKMLDLFKKAQAMSISPTDGTKDKNG